VFAERGFADGTSKEICERAGTPMASVNYHFGSRESLYEAVLLEAHRQVMALDDLLALTHGPGDPTQKLRLLLARLIGFSAQGAAPWGFRVVLREIMTPTAAGLGADRPGDRPQVPGAAGLDRGGAGPAARTPSGPALA
jgi:AcrR family transcriptional regulator